MVRLNEPSYKLPERNLEPPDDGPFPKCPICGNECDTIYYNSDGELVGCDECVKTGDAYDEPKCLPAMETDAD